MRARTVESRGVLGETLRLCRREVVRLVEVLVKLVELPFVRVERRARRMIGNGLPALVPQPAVPKLLEVLRGSFRRRRQVREARLEAHTLERQLPDTVDLGRRLDADDVEQRRQDVRHMAELVPQLPARGDALWPRDDEWVADSAAVRVLLVAAERRVRRHRPAVREVVVHLRTTDVLKAGELFRPELGAQIARAEGDAAE